MPIFNIQIEEILQRQIPIRAKSVTDAMKTVDTMYKNQEIILDSEDLKKTSISHTETTYEIKGQNKVLGKIVV